MTKEKDPAEVVSAIKRSIEVSQYGSRRVRAHRFKELFGYQALSAQRRERVEALLKDAGVLVQPSLENAGRDDWLVMSIPVAVDVLPAHPDPRPTKLLDHLQSVRPDTEREVEMHFASPLFQGLGYTEDQEAAGHGIRVYLGSRPAQHVEADLVYFVDARRDPENSEPLVLVECKRPGKDLAAAVGQVRSYALWLLPAYYVITNAQTVTVYDFQGAIAPDIKVLEVHQSELGEKFDDLYARLNPQAAASARRQKITKIAPAR